MMTETGAVYGCQTWGKDGLIDALEAMKRSIKECRIMFPLREVCVYDPDLLYRDYEVRLYIPDLGIYGCLVEINYEMYDIFKDSIVKIADKLTDDSYIQIVAIIKGRLKTYY